MRKMFVYGTAVLALSVAPLVAQQPAAGSAPTRTAAPAMSSADRQFVMEAARGGLAEVELGKLAVDKASSDQVKQFGKKMVDDHGKVNDELKTFAQGKNITLPTDLDAKSKATKERLEKLSGAAFDRAYMQDMVADHRQDVTEFRKQSKSAADPDLRAWATKTLPTLEEHLQMAQTASRSAVGTSGSKSSSEGTKTNNGTSGTAGSTPRSGSGAGAPTGSGSSSPR